MADIKRIIQEYLQEQPMLPMPFGSGVDGVGASVSGDDGMGEKRVVVSLTDLNLTDEEIRVAADSDGAGGAGGGAGGGGGGFLKPGWAGKLKVVDKGYPRFGPNGELYAPQQADQEQGPFGGQPKP